MTSDILIIGAGAAGLSSALELAQRGRRVTVLERGCAGGESTWAGGGIVSPLLPWHYGPEVNRLSEYSRSLMRDWTKHLQDLSGQDPEYLQSGMLVMPPFDAAQAKDWCALHDWSWQERPSHEYLPAGESVEALWLPDVAQVRNPALTRALRGAVHALGVKLIEGAEVQSLLYAGRHITGVQTVQGNFLADQVVLAAGAWSGQLPGCTVLAKRVFPIRGQMLLFRLAPDRLRCIVFAQGKYLIPRRDGHVLAGSTLEDVGFDKSTTHVAREALLGFATGLMPALNASTLIRQWSGLRPGSPNNVPCIGRHPDFDNLFLNTGHFRYGLTMAPGSARLLTALMLDETPPIDPIAYVL